MTKQKKIYILMASEQNTPRYVIADTMQAKAMAKAFPNLKCYEYLEGMGYMGDEKEADFGLRAV